MTRVSDNMFIIFFLHCFTSVPCVGMNYTHPTLQNYIAQFDLFRSRHQI